MRRQRHIQVCPLRRIQTEPTALERVALTLNYRTTTSPFHRQAFHKLRCPRCHRIRRVLFILPWVPFPVYLKPFFPSQADRTLSLRADRLILRSGPRLLARRASAQVRIVPLRISSRFMPRLSRTIMRNHVVQVAHQRACYKP